MRFQAHPRGKTVAHRDKCDFSGMRRRTNPHSYSRELPHCCSIAASWCVELRHSTDRRPTGQQCYLKEPTVSVVLLPIETHLPFCGLQVTHKPTLLLPHCCLIVGSLWWWVWERKEHMLKRVKGVHCSWSGEGVYLRAVLWYSGVHSLLELSSSLPPCVATDVVFSLCRFLPQILLRSMSSTTS